MSIVSSKSKGRRVRSPVEDRVNQAVRDPYTFYLLVRTIRKRWRFSDDAARQVKHLVAERLVETGKFREANARLRMDECNYSLRKIENRYPGILWKVSRVTKQLSTGATYESIAKEYVSKETGKQLTRQRVFQIRKKLTQFARWANMKPWDVARKAEANQMPETMLEEFVRVHRWKA